MWRNAFRGAPRMKSVLGFLTAAVLAASCSTVPTSTSTVSTSSTTETGTGLHFVNHGDRYRRCFGNGVAVSTGPCG
jgi:hypothetical protein